MQNITVPAPSKINLFLHILGQRPDGYHDIQTVFQFVDWCDELNFHLRDDGRINLNPELFGVQDADNLIVKAAHALQQHADCQLGADIILNKNIPMGAGLGGGSSDAATTLLALNQLWKLNLDLDQLTEIGVELGADVPVFVHGHSAWAEGIGDKLTPIILPEPWYLLAMPPCHVMTGSLYQDPRLRRDNKPLTIGSYHLGDGVNDFTPIVREDFPQVGQALDWLNQHGQGYMTGSGGTCFAQFDSAEEASRIAAQAPKSFATRVVKGMNHSPLQKLLTRH